MSPHSAAGGPPRATTQRPESGGQRRPVSASTAPTDRIAPTPISQALALARACPCLSEPFELSAPAAACQNNSSSCESCALYKDRLRVAELRIAELEGPAAPAQQRDISAAHRVDAHVAPPTPVCTPRQASGDKNDKLPALGSIEISARTVPGTQGPFRDDT